MSRFFERLQPWAALLMRLVLAAAILHAGYGKVVPSGGLHGNNLFSAVQQWDARVVHMGLPAWLGAVSAFTEFFGGIFLVLGLLVRPVSLLVALNMLVAIVKVTGPKGYIASQHPLALFALATALMAFGSGAVALDNRLGLE
jgi:putative oxidoreductase